MGAEKYSRRLSERITEGYAAKFDQETTGGKCRVGFRRSPEPPNTLQIDPATIDTAVVLFERYALGTVSAAQLAAETGLEATRIRCILMNPLYNGWIRRHRGPNETRKPAHGAPTRCLRRAMGQSRGMSGEPSSRAQDLTATTESIFLVGCSTASAATDQERRLGRRQTLPQAPYQTV